MNKPAHDKYCPCCSLQLISVKDTTRLYCPTSLIAHGPCDYEYKVGDSLTPINRLEMNLRHKARKLIEKVEIELELKRINLELDACC
jgi:hypothetical protein